MTQSEQRFDRLLKAMAEGEAPKPAKKSDRQMTAKAPKSDSGEPHR